METGGPAFPANHFDMAESEHGMTLRDYFAAKAMQAMLSAYPCQAIGDIEGGIQADWHDLASDAYEMANAMMKAREQ